MRQLGLSAYARARGRPLAGRGQMPRRSQIAGPAATGLPHALQTLGAALGFI
jgi:hypothetical protein